jgi:hypothetical protein
MYYETPELFMAEARQQGISRRLNHMPKGFRLGEHWVFLAHPAAIFNSHVVDDSKSQTGTRVVLAPSPGIFHIFRPNAIEKIVTEEQAQDEAAMKVLRDHGITPIIVGTNDVDHQGGPKQMEMELAD